MKKIVIFLFLYCLIGRVWAQDPFYRLIGKSEGLPSNSVYDVFQDSKGFIWCSHDEGLSKYDGFTFKTYSSKEQTSKAGSYIREDKFGRIWYSNFDGFLYYVENETLKELKMSKPFGYTRYGINDKYVFVIVQNGIEIFDLESLKLLKKRNNSLRNFVSSLNFNNSFYVQLDSIIVFESLDEPTKFSVKNQPGFVPNMNMIYSNSEGILFAGKETKGENNFQLNKGNNVKIIQSKFKGFFQNYSVTDGIYWACAQSGVLGFDSKNNSEFNNGKVFFTDYNLSSVFKDKRGNFWFSTLSDGLIFVPDLYIKRLTIKNEKPLKIIEKNNGFFIGTRSGKVLLNDLNGNAKEISGDKQHEVISVVYDSLNGNLFCSSRGLDVFDKHYRNIYRKTFSLKDICRIDKNYYAYASSGNIGLINISGKPAGSIWDSLHFSNLIQNDKTLSSIDPLTIRGKSVTYSSGLNSIFFATNLGLYIANPSGVKELKFGDESVFIKKLQSSFNRIFCLNGNGRLFEIIEGKEFKKLNVPSNIKDIKCSGNFLFLITEEHLYQINLKKPGDVYIQLEYIAKGQEINDVVFLKNQLVIATNMGLVISEKNENNLETYKAPFYINYLKIGNKRVSNFLGEEFNSYENEVEINYSILDYNKANELSLFYKINENDWVQCSNNSRNINLPSLSPGKYKIEFKIGNYEIENQKIEFVIKKPIYFQWWFILIALIIVTGFLAIVYQIRLQRIKIENRLKLEKIELQKSLGQSMLTAIKSQMNPHFFYNALNTIQSFIYSDDKKKASSYLAKFSKLTRLILEMSEKETVSLADEIIALRLYLELEEVRFEEVEFHYSIILNNKIESEMVQIPSMMIQPYIENAIKHGLLHKLGRKELEIRIWQDVGILIVEVEDNGVGRDKSSKINASKYEKWKSFSTGANEKRLEILNRGRSKAIGVAIQDKVDENGLPTGTLVKISIPLNN
ncbi:MAG: sensor histidine kinase [Bacteroidia bacterium]